MIEDYLDNGGYLFVSGAEIGWDLDLQGTPQDGEFYNNYLKAFYVADAPDNVSSTYYEVFSLGNGLLDTLSLTSFDDGTNGTYNVGYPDVMLGTTGGIEILGYNGVVNQSAGVFFEGRFPGASIQDTGKIVHFGFPFETVYPASKRLTIIAEINDFFFPKVDGSTTGLNAIDLTRQIVVYPNPVNDLLYFSAPINEAQLFDLQGKLLISKMDVSLLDLRALGTGTYILKLTDNQQVVQKKIQVIH